MGAPMGTRLIRREGRAGSGVTIGDRNVRRMREHASLGARRERDVTEHSHSFQKRSWRNGLCCGTVDAGGGNEPDPQVTQSDGGHARSHCEQPERGSTHHSTREAALCVGGIRGDDESEEMHSRREFA